VSSSPVPVGRMSYPPKCSPLTIFRQAQYAHHALDRQGPGRSITKPRIGARSGWRDQHNSLRPQRRQVRMTHSTPPIISSRRSQGWSSALHARGAWTMMPLRARVEMGYCGYCTRVSNRRRQSPPRELRCRRSIYSLNERGRGATRNRLC
jgi:hypothetical protein